MPLKSDHHRFLYIAIPKTGSSTMTHYLKAHYGAIEQGRHHAAEYSVPAGYLCWTVVRNPYPRLLSWWDAWTFGYIGREYPPEDRPSHTCSFAEFIAFMADNRDGEDLPEQIRMIRAPQHLYSQYQPCTVLIKLENIQDEFRSLPFAKPIPFGQRRNIGKWRDRGTLQDFYGQPGVAEAADKFGIEEECEALGYPVEMPA